MQVLLHGLGVLGNVWMILDRWHWMQLYVMATLFALIPFLLELSVIFAARSQMKQMTLMRAKQDNELKKHQSMHKRVATVARPMAVN